MGSPHHTSHSHSMPRPYRCSNCSKSYAMDWAKANHQKLCIEREKSK